MLWGMKITEVDYYYFVIQNQCASGSALYSLVSRFLFLLIVVREYQTEVIVVPALLVGFFVIVLTVILWLHCRGLRAKQQQSSSSGHQGKKKVFQPVTSVGFSGRKSIPFPHCLSNSQVVACTKSLSGIQQCSEP